MKKVFFCLILLIGIFSSCVDEVSKSRVRVQRTVDSLNSSCPVNLDIIKVKSLRFNHDTITANFALDGTYYPLDIFKAAYVTEKYDMNFLNYLSFITGCKDAKQMRKDLVKIGAAIKIVIEDKNTNNGFVTIMTKEDIKKYAERKITKEERSRIRLKCKIAGERMRCPYDNGDGTISNDVRVEGNYVVFEYIVNEKIINIDYLNANLKLAKAAILEEYSKAKAITLYSDIIAIKGSHMGAKYKYIGDKSRKVAVVALEYEDIPNIGDVQERINDEFNMRIFN